MRLAIAAVVILAGLGYLVGRALGVNWYDLRDALLARWSKAWRWLLWSPRRFAVALLVIAAGFWGWAQLANSPGASQAAPSPVDSTLPTGWREWPTVAALNAGVRHGPRSCHSNREQPASAVDRHPDTEPYAITHRQRPTTPGRASSRRRGGVRCSLGAPRTRQGRLARRARTHCRAAFPRVLALGQPRDPRPRPGRRPRDP